MKYRSSCRPAPARALAYTHLDPARAPNANTGSALYTGDGIPGLKSQLVFTDWISFNKTPKQGLPMHAAVNRDNLQEVSGGRALERRLHEVALNPSQPIMYTSIVTNQSGDRIFVGGFKEIQFIVNRATYPLGSPNFAGGLYEVVRN